MGKYNGGVKWESGRFLANFELCEEFMRMLGSTRESKIGKQNREAKWEAKWEAH